MEVGLGCTLLQRIVGSGMQLLLRVVGRCVRVRLLESIVGRLVWLLQRIRGSIPALGGQWGPVGQSNEGSSLDAWVLLQLWEGATLDGSDGQAMDAWVLSLAPR